MEAVLPWLLPIGLAVAVLILLGVVLRTQFARGARSAPVTLQGRDRAREHAATHHAIWLPVVQELGLPVRAEVEGQGTRLRMTGHRRDVALTLDVHIPWAFSAEVWHDLREGRGIGAEREVEADALEQLRLELDVPTDAPMPDGLQVGLETGRSRAMRYLGVHDVQTGDPALDARIRVRGDDRHAVRGLAMDPRVRAALARVARLDLPFTWTAEGIRLTAHPHRVHRFRPGQAKEYADACTGLAAAAAARQWAPWGKLGSALDLARAGQRLSGTISGVAVRIDARFDEGLAEVDVGKALRPLHLAASDPGGPGDPVKFPDPLLAKALAGRTRDKFLARRVLSDEPTATALVEVLGGTDGAALVDGVLRLPIRPGEDTPGIIRAAVALSSRLVRAAR